MYHVQIKFLMLLPPVSLYFVTSYRTQLLEKVQGSKVGQEVGFRKVILVLPNCFKKNL